MISIIIPVYNTEKYLKKCIESVLYQRNKNYEIILVDDGSTDGSLKICEFYNAKYENIKLIKQNNKGAAAARNEGLKNSNGDYILFLDSDDFVADNSLNKIYECLNKNEDVDVIFLEGVKYFEVENKEVRLDTGMIKDNIENKPKEDVLKFLSTLPKYPGSACTKLIKRDLIIENNIYFIEGITNEDIEWTLEILVKSKKFAYCETKYYYYRQNRKGSVTNTFSKTKFECLFNTIKKNVDIDNNSEYGKFKNEIYSFMAYEYNLLIAIYSKLNKDDKKIFRPQLKEYKWLMNFRKDKKNKLIKIAYTIFGLDITSYLLNLYLKIR